MPTLHRHSRALLGVRLSAFVLLIFGFTAIGARSQGPSAPTAAAAVKTAAVKPDARRARAAFQLGQTAEQQQNWQVAYEAYSEAVDYAPGNRNYEARRDAARSALVQQHVEAGERDAVSGKLDEARRELLAASNLDPSNGVVRERLAELTAAREPSETAGEQLAGEPHLDYQQGTRSFNYRGDTRGAYDEIARQFGVEDAFDVALNPRPVHFVAPDVDFPTAMRVLGAMTDTFWTPLTRRLFFVAEDSPQKRRDYGESAMRTVLLPASATTADMTETLRIVRDISGVNRATLDTSAHAITMRASPQAIAVASNVIDGIQTAPGELVLEINVLEVDRNLARQLGITPPQAARAFVLTPKQVEQASQSAENLVNIIQQVFGLPTSLSGLSPEQIAGLLASGNLAAGTLIPPVVAFGGGQTTFLATLPGATAHFGEMLSLVKHGERILLRAQDGQPATFFAGQHYPISYAHFSSSLDGTTIPGVSSSNFPKTEYDTGNSPQFVTSANLRQSTVINDLIVANEVDGTVGVLLGNGVTQPDGTFAAQVAYQTDPATVNSGPVWIAAADLNGDGHVDLAVANNTSDNVGILLASAAGDGTFQPATTIRTGRRPVSVVTGLFHDATASSHLDLAVATQGDDSISVFEGNGDGTFAVLPTVLQLPTGFEPVGLAAVDVNGDGHTDLIVADSGNDSVSVFLSNGDGTFETRADYATGVRPVFVAAADLNGDGVVDLAVANNGAPNSTNSGNSVSILLGQKTPGGRPTGTFAPGPTRDYPAGASPTSLVIGDFNVDGLPDLIVADGAVRSSGATGDNAVSILLGTGSGTFSTNFELPVGANPQSIVSGNFNTDSKLDIATADAGANKVTVVLNASSVFTGANSTSAQLTPFPSVQYIDVGLKVKATPRIHNDGDVTIDMDLSLSSIAAQSFNSIPVINNEAVQQIVRLKQDQTNTVATFLSPVGTTGISGTPGIANLPGVSWLAKSEDAENQNTEILVLVTPRMVRYPERKDRLIYAGQGALEGEGAGPVFAPPQPGQPAVPGQPIPGQPITPGFAPGQQPPNPQQPGQQPGQPVQQPVQPPIPPPNQPPGQGQPQQPDQPQPNQPPNQSPGQQNPPFRNPVGRDDQPLVQ